MQKCSRQDCTNTESLTEYSFIANWDSEQPIITFEGMMCDECSKGTSNWFANSLAVPKAELHVNFKHAIYIKDIK